MRIITISRQLGSAGDDIAHHLARQLDWHLVDRNRARELLVARGVQAQGLRLLDERAPALMEGQMRNRLMLFAILQQELRVLAMTEPLVVLGLGGAYLLAEDPEALHAKVIRSRPLRVVAIADEVGEERAQELVAQSDRDRAAFVRCFQRQNWTDATLYDLTLCTDRLTVEAAVACIIASSTQMEAQERAQLIQHREAVQKQAQDETYVNQVRPSRITTAGVGVSSSNAQPNEVQFAHPSEQEFARVLSYYRIPWLYEPHTFPLQWDEQGRVTEAFSPDFYLPHLEMYLELTTMKQSLVTRKNRKVRRLRELYPDVSVKVIYGRDYHRLLRRFGKEDEQPLDV